MKRFLYIISAVLPLCVVSCVKENAFDGGNGSDVPITFTAATYVSQTKASSSDFTDDDFHVNAWTSGGIRYMNDVEVTKGSGSVWSTTTAYYWPKADKLRFIATHGRVTSGPWATINISGSDTTLTTGATDIKFRPTLSTNQDSLWLYTDKTGEYDYTATSVPILFKNALASVKATINVRMGNDVIQKDAKEKYREYDVYAPADSAGKTTYYVVPYGLTPNGFIPETPTFTYPIKVKLKTPITHIWRVIINRISAVNVANTGKLEMTLKNNEWTIPTNSIWVVPEHLTAHKDSVILYDSKQKSDLNGTPIPANMTDYECPVSGSHLVMPQDLNWSSVSTINNQKASVEVTVEVYNKDINEDGVFDYRDVYQYWVWNAKDANGKVTDSTLVSDAETAKDYNSNRFCSWYAWDGSGSSVLTEVHTATEGMITYAKVLDNLTPHLKYPLTTSIDLAKISSDEETHYWKMNRMTTYQINITPVTNEITFTPDVKTWTNASGVTIK